MTIKVQLNNIRDKSTWGGKEPKNHSPGFDYCRKLIKEGTSPDESLEVYRGDILSRTYGNIGEAAKFKIREDKYIGPVVIPYIELDEETRATFANIRAAKATRSTH